MDEGGNEVLDRQWNERKKNAGKVLDRQSDDGHAVVVGVCRRVGLQVSAEDLCRERCVAMEAKGKGMMFGGRPVR
jgi:hypothetical protein